MRSAKYILTLTALILGFFYAGSKTLLAQSQGDVSDKKEARASVLRKEEAVAQLQSSTVERVAVEVSFDGGVEAAEFGRTVSPTGAKVKSLLYKWGEHSAGYNLDEGQTLDDALEDFGKRHVEFLLRQINNLSAPSNQAALTTGDADWERSRQKLLEEFSAQLALSREKGLMLSGFVAEDAPGALSRLLKSLPEESLSFQISGVTEAGADSKPKRPVSDEMSGGDAASAPSSSVASNEPYPGQPWKFSPSRGQINYDAQARYLTSYFVWDDVSGFNSLHFGYEHDITIFTDKKGDFKFGSKDWYSSLPQQPSSPDKRPSGDRRYKDDTLLDEQASFTIGTGAATEIKAGVTYYVDIPVAVQNDKAGPTTGVVQPQLSSWAGEYDDGSDPSESKEVAYCLLNGGADYSHCMNADQHFTIINYYNDSGVYRNFPFDYRVSAKFNWNKSYIPTAPQISCPQGQFRAEYTNLDSGNLTFARCESSPINYNWGSGNPGNGVLNDRFKVEWSGQFSFTQGTHRFIASSDDGMQVYVDGNLIINSWYDRPETEERVERIMSAGIHTIVVKYYENKGNAAAKFRWEALGGSGCTASVAADRWKGEYFNNTALSGSPVMVRDDSDPNGGTFFAHDWGTGSPNANCGIGTDNFSARWTRRQSFDAGQYKFTLRADDGVRLYVDGVLRLERWIDQPPTSYSVDVNLTAGQHDLRVDYYEHGGGAVAQIYWERTGGGTVPPTISKYTWDATPKADQPFGGGVLGTGFVVSGTRVFFCQTNTSNCYEHPSAGVTVNNSTNLTVTNVKLSGGSWQVQVQTSAGKSQLSEPFAVQAPPANCIATVASDHWKGEYFNNTTLSGSPVMVRDDSSSSTPFFAHDWGTGSPNANCGVNTDNFSARWTRRQSFDAGRYRFTLRADDGFRLYVDGVLRLERWFDQPPTSYNVELDLSAGQHDLRVDYYEHADGAVAQIYWERIGATATPPTVSDYSWTSTPKAGQAFSGTVTGTGFVVGATQLFFCVNGGTACYEHPSAGVKVNSATNMSATNVNLGAGSWQLYVKTAAGSSGRSAAFTVQSPPQPPTVSSYSWTSTPVAGQFFNGTVTGTGFISGDTQLWFCVNGSTSCYQHPSAGVTVNSPNSLSASNVNLGAGSWQLYVKTSAGQSGRSSAFNVAAPPARPTVTNYSWSSTPRADQTFGGTIDGTGFVNGSTQVWFCLSGTNSCYQHPSAGVTVNSSTRLTVSNVRLDSGAWQFYVKTSAGQSDRSSSFAVFAGSPTISGYSWNTTPLAGQFFGGTISGSNFVPGGTQVWFCVAGSSTCYQHPSAGVTVNSVTSLSVSSVKLGAGSWQVYLQTYAGTSSRSSTFTVR